MQKLSRKVWTWIIVGVILLGAAGYLYYQFNYQQEKLTRSLEKLPTWLQPLNPLAEEVEPLYITVVIPEQNEGFGKELNRVIELFQADIDAQNNVNGHPVKVIPYDDGFDKPDEAIAAAEQIVADGRSLVVIGHIYSASSLAISPIYSEAGIPIITPSAGDPAVTQTSKWFFRTISDSSTMSAYAGLYSRMVLNHERASIIYEDNSFGKSLEETFLETFEKNGGTIVYDEKMSHQDSLNEVGAGEALKIIEKMTAPDAEDPGIIFLGLNDNEAQQFMYAMRNAGKNYPLIAAYDQGDSNFAELFANDPQEKAHPGYFTDDMVAFSPVIFDVSGQAAHDFYEKYVNAYSEPPTWLGATVYDAMLVAVQAIHETGATGHAETITEERAKIREYISSLNSPSRSVNGLTGQVHFDENRNFTRPPIFGTFLQRSFTSSPNQLRPVLDARLIPNLQTSIHAGDVIQNGGQYIYKTSVVYTGIKLNKISNLDVDKDHTFTADFYLWFRYQGDLDVEDIEFINATDPIQLEAPVSILTVNGMNYKLYRVRAKFNTTSELRDYPFDNQNLIIQFRHKNLTSERLIYVEDILGMDNATQSNALITRLNQGRVFDAGDNWNLTDGRIFIDVYSSRASLGNPVFIGSQPSLENSQFNVKIDIERNSMRFMLKTMFPLFCLVALAYLSLFLPGYKFETIISVMTGTVLSIVFFHVNLSNRLSVGYNVALDYVFYATYFLYILELMITIIAWHYYQKDEVTARKRIYFARILYPVYLFIAGTLFLWLYSNPTGNIALEGLRGIIPGL